jgi:hypothetical protein
VGAQIRIILLLVVLLLIPTKIFATTPVIEGLDQFKISTRKLKQVANWKGIPSIVVCPHTPIDRDQVKEALNVWKKLGYVFYSTIYFKDSRAALVCQNPDPNGYIIIDLVTQDTFGNLDDLAVTHFYVDNDTKELYWARIYLKTNVRERVLEHELGHAVGWMHSVEKGHLMHEKLINGGWNISGLKKP